MGKGREEEKKKPNVFPTFLLTSLDFKRPIKKKKGMLEILNLWINIKGGLHNMAFIMYVEITQKTGGGNGNTLFLHYT